MTQLDLDDELRHLLAEFTGVHRRRPTAGALIALAATGAVAGLMAWLALR